VISDKIENYGDMFRFTEPSSGQIHNTALVHSVSAHTILRTHWMYQCCVVYLAWWWFSEPKYVAV